MKVCIGIDQSYFRTGISISCDGKIKKISSIYLSQYKSNTDKRNGLADRLYTILAKITQEVEASKILIVIERIRLVSQGNISCDYIKAVGALNATIVDIAHEFGIKVYSVDTRAWKKAVVGTTKELKNKIGVNPKKYPTIKYLIANGFEREIMEPAPKRKIKGVFMRNGTRYVYNDDAADSACISLFPFKGSKTLLRRER